jgi:ribosome-associated protein
MGEIGIKPNKIEGYQSNNWIILDYSDVLVHIFYAETREFYSLEKLWADGQQIDLLD